MSFLFFVDVHRNRPLFENRNIPDTALSQSSVREELYFHPIKRFQDSISMQSIQIFPSPFSSSFLYLFSVISSHPDTSHWFSNYLVIFLDKNMMQFDIISFVCVWRFMIAYEPPLCSRILPSTVCFTIWESGMAESIEIRNSFIISSKLELILLMLPEG